MELKTKKFKTEKLKNKQRIWSEVSVNSPRGVSPEEEKEDYGGKDLRLTVFALQMQILNWTEFNKFK